MNNLALRRNRKKVRAAVMLGLPAVMLVAAMVLDTKVVAIGSNENVGATVFSPDNFGETEFPKLQKSIEDKSVDAVTLVTALQENRDAAVAKYGVPGSIGPAISVKFSGVVGQGRSGIYFVSVPGLPDDVRIRVQTGPAINGTDIRDATGTISFGQFKNQIEYQDAGAALNREMKKTVLSKLDTSTLTGKTISVVGVFQLVNPKSWLVAPVALEVK